MTIHKFLLITFLFLAVVTTATAADTELFDIVLGGKIYDNWMNTLDEKTLNSRQLDKKKFLNNHPAYPPTSRKKSFVTWRCKECHGWDYQGVDGAYRKGAHFTGIKGIYNMMGATPDKIITTIRDKNHKYTKKMIDDTQAKALALFVTRGLLDMNLYIDSASKKVRGEAARGYPFFQTICAVCHGLDGKEINFGSSYEPEFVGTVANHNPWEALHKIRNGHPGTDMVSMRALPIQTQVDILAFIQTLSAN